MRKFPRSYTYQTWNQFNNSSAENLRELLILIILTWSSFNIRNPLIFSSFSHFHMYVYTCAHRLTKEFPFNLRKQSPWMPTLHSLFPVPPRLLLYVNPCLNMHARILNWYSNKGKDKYISCFIHSQSFGDLSQLYCYKILHTTVIVSESDISFTLPSPVLPVFPQLY